MKFIFIIQFEPLKIVSKNDVFPPAVFSSRFALIFFRNIYYLCITTFLDPNKNYGLWRLCLFIFFSLKFNAKIVRMYFDLTNGHCYMN